MRVSALRARGPIASVLAGAMYASAGDAMAGGFSVNEISTEGLGRANSGEVADTGANALWWNPAAIARSPREVSVALSRRDHDIAMRDNGSTITFPVPPAGLTVPTGGGAVSDASEDLTAPYGAFATPVGERFAIGLSVARPFRLKTELGAASWTRYDTIRSQIEITDVQLTGAWQATDWLDLGLGVSGQYNDAYLDQAWPNLAAGAPDAVSRLKADGWAYGWTLGAQARFETVTLGASYRSKVDHDLDGSLAVSGLLAPLDAFNFTAPATAKFTTPWQMTVGARWAVTPQLTLNGQVERVGWGEYDVITVDFGQTAVIPQRFEDVTAFALGVDYVVSDLWTVRAGFRNEPTPTPDSLREPGVWDADSKVYAVGASVYPHEAVTVHGAIAYTDFDDAVLVDNDVFYAGSAAETTARSRGVLSGKGVSASIGLDVRF